MTLTDRSAEVDFPEVTRRKDLTGRKGGLSRLCGCAELAPSATAAVERDSVCKVVVLIVSTRPSYDYGALAIPESGDCTSMPTVPFVPWTPAQLAGRLG